MKIVRFARLLFYTKAKARCSSGFRKGDSKTEAKQRSPCLDLCQVNASLNCKAMGNPPAGEAIDLMKHGDAK
jgi:hypothetical protein